MEQTQYITKENKWEQVFGKNMVLIFSIQARKTMGDTNRLAF
jgi:hypothetical protein